MCVCVVCVCGVCVQCWEGYFRIVIGYSYPLNVISSVTFQLLY